jgi:hypothetical protein
LLSDPSLPKIVGIDQFPLYRAEAYGYQARLDDDASNDYLRWFRSVAYPLFITVAT